jgi:hypothetical protein
MSIWAKYRRMAIISSICLSAERYPEERGLAPVQIFQPRLAAVSGQRERCELLSALESTNCTD